MNSFEIQVSPLPGLLTMTRPLHRDRRGYFERLYCSEAFVELGLKSVVRQINHTLTRKVGTVRGMHFQRPPAAEDKIVSCFRGEVFDVAIDLRAGSPTFLKWYGVHLSEENFRSVLVPKGFAHGFQALRDNCELLYFHTHEYVPEYEGGVNPLDPRVGISWPIPVAECSDKDRNRSLLSQDFSGMDV